MNYKRFYIKISPADNLIRQDKLGKETQCKGYEVEIFDSEEKLKLDEISIAVGFEILKMIYTRLSSLSRIILTVRKRNIC